MSEFFDMGGYGAFVWPAYFVSAFVLAALTYSIWRRGRILKKKLDASAGAARRN
jgi:heme exporter protein CcmD